MIDPSPPTMIDLHCHILPGIDDGPATIEESVAMVRGAHAAGIEAIVATPHVSWKYPNEAATIALLTAELNERLAAEGVPVEIHAGAELAMTRVGDVAPDQVAQMRLGSGPWVLLEPPFTSAVTGLGLVMAQLRGAGHRVVLAHPERCPAFQREPHTLRTLVDAGALSSITAGSLTGRFGSQVRRFALRLLEEGLVHNVASDAHDRLRRPPSIAAELERSGLRELAGWLTQEVPAAILSGADIPPRPAGLPSAGRRVRTGWPWRRARNRPGKENNF